jgi:hypothetical protein
VISVLDGVKLERLLSGWIPESPGHLYPAPSYPRLSLLRRTPIRQYRRADIRGRTRMSPPPRRSAYAWRPLNRSTRASMVGMRRGAMTTTIATVRARRSTRWNPIRIWTSRERAGCVTLGIALKKWDGRGRGRDVCASGPRFCRDYACHNRDRLNAAKRNEYLDGSIMGLKD